MAGQPACRSSQSTSFTIKPRNLPRNVAAEAPPPPPGPRNPHSAHTAACPPIRHLVHLYAKCSRTKCQKNELPVIMCPTPLPMLHLYTPPPTVPPMPCSIFSQALAICRRGAFANSPRAGVTCLLYSHAASHPCSLHPEHTLLPQTSAPASICPAVSPPPSDF